MWENRGKMAHDKPCSRIGQRKVGNALIWKAGTSECLKFVLDKWLGWSKHLLHFLIQFHFLTNSSFNPFNMSSFFNQSVVFQSHMSNTWSSSTSNVLLFCVLIEWNMLPFNPISPPPPLCRFKVESLIAFMAASYQIKYSGCLVCFDTFPQILFDIFWKDVHFYGFEHFWGVCNDPSAGQWGLGG